MACGRRHGDPEVKITCRSELTHRPGAQSSEIEDAPGKMSITSRSLLLDTLRVEDSVPEPIEGSSNHLVDQSLVESHPATVVAESIQREPRTRIPDTCSSCFSQLLIRRLNGYLIE